MTAAETTGWSNWAGTASASPRRTARPRDVDELVSVVRGAADEGLTVKAVGAGHSFTSIAATDGVLVRMDGLDAPVRVDAARGLVTVEAGMRLSRLNQVLDAHGLALTNLGDIDVQTVSGAISTGTHGTGRSSGSLAEQVHALELVTADGRLLRCSAEERPELFAAARIGLGALGLISRVTLRCEPAFTLHALETPMPLDRVLDGLDQLVSQNEHFEFYWFPHTTRTLTKRNNRLPAGARSRPLHRVRAWLDDEFLSNTLFEGVNRVAAARPSLVPGLNAVSCRALSSRGYTAPSHRVFTAPRRVVFRETEYAVPRAALPELLAGVRSWVDRSGERIPFPVEVRFTPADDVWLSTAYGRESAYVAVHQYHRLPYERYFRAVAGIADALGGRPHWGKLHWLDAERLRELHPRLDDFCRLRAELDPEGRLSNPYLDRVLGPVGPGTRTNGGS
ncbi:D-arabinono-1,4-lactone oxidase [Streptomyces otsuchiensis]|uniref:D-arabinono-1,4-lactone oxidase n=1 Tax=Streptomyces otsuchiensis TaxID=2681388 RepID=UPI00103065EF|nr:D-arabinono-1,4-lactone oxidase [Streptomyces otsuchiensis]